MPRGGLEEVAAAESEVAFADIALVEGKTGARTSMSFLFLCWLRNEVTDTEARQFTQNGMSSNQKRELLAA